MNNVHLQRDADSAVFAVAARSMIGGRREQQDRAYACLSEREAFAVVCDGMGGTAGGGQASALAVEAAEEAYRERRPEDGEIPRFLLDTVNEADHRVFRAFHGGDGGTTMVAALARDDRLFWTSVGDSRLYILRSGELLQVTRDHNYYLRLDELRAAGAITEEEYDTEKARGEALISYIGMGGVDLYDLTETGFPLRPRDILILSTDGLFKVLPHDRIREILNLSGLSLMEKANELISVASTAIRREYQDNATFVLISVL